MNKMFNKQITEKLIREFNRVIDHHFRMVLDEIITEILILGEKELSSSDMLDIISHVRINGTEKLSLDRDILRLYKAIEQIANCSYVWCNDCGNTIQEECLLREPLLEYFPQYKVTTGSPHKQPAKQTGEFNQYIQTNEVPRLTSQTQ